MHKNDGGTEVWEVTARYVQVPFTCFQSTGIIIYQLQHEIMYLLKCGPNEDFNQPAHQGPFVQSIVSLTSSLRVISLTVLADLIYDILIFFAEKM